MLQRRTGTVFAGDCGKLRAALPEGDFFIADARGMKPGDMRVFEYDTQDQFATALTRELTGIYLTERELATVLAALRHYQRITLEGDDSPLGLPDIATNCGEFTALDAREVDVLCEQLNAGEGL